MAHHRSRKKQLLVLASAGAFAFLATTCKVTLVVIILLPILTLVYDHCCGVKAEGLGRAVITFIGTYVTAVLAFFLVLGLRGLTGDLFTGWSLSSSLYHNGVTILAP
jgi:hypothetical protein